MLWAHTGSGALSSLHQALLLSANHYFPDESDSWSATSINSIYFYYMTKASQELCWNYQFIHRELGMASLLCLKSFQSKPDLWHIISMWVIPLEHKKHHLPSLCSRQSNPTFLLYFYDYDTELYLKLGHLCTHSNSGLIWIHFLVSPQRLSYSQKLILDPW